VFKPVSKLPVPQPRLGALEPVRSERHTPFSPPLRENISRASPPEMIFEVEDFAGLIPQPPRNRPRTAMSAPPLRDEQERADLLAPSRTFGFALWGAVRHHI